MTTSGAQLFRAADDADGYITLEEDTDGTYLTAHSDLYEVEYDLDTAELEDEFRESWLDDMERTIVFHGTRDDESAAAINSEGLGRRSDTRGINNRYVGDAVYATTEPELAASYGVVFEIDLPRAMADGVVARGDLDREPGYFKADVMQSIAHDFADYTGSIRIRSSTGPVRTRRLL